jgi:5-methylcytosine-specific restriction endonuclease McrA
MRKKIIERDDGTDQYVLHTSGALRPGFSVHHIIPLSERWDLRLDEHNLITLSDDTHASLEYKYKTKYKTNIQQELFAIVEQVTAARAAGD